MFVHTYIIMCSVVLPIILICNADVLIDCIRESIIIYHDHDGYHVRITF